MALGFVATPALKSAILAAMDSKAALGPIQDLLVRHGARTVSEGAITVMPGGASTRRYFRVALAEGGSAVAMFVPEGSKAEEIDKAEVGTRWPFLEVRDLLAERGLDVPRILAEDTRKGWLLIEDLGDDTLAQYLLRRPEQKRAVYTRAVQDLARAQAALWALPDGCVVSRRAFDFDLLRWEIEHFKEWGIEGRGHSMTADDEATFAGIADRLARRVADLPRGFVHRDYQSRNLMVRDQGGEDFSLVWIDFQDALLGPRAYDLVALLGDSYQEFDRAFVEARLDEFAEARGLSRVDRDGLGYEFDLVTVQRKLKDAGRFVFIDRVKQNPGFLKFVTPTVLKVKAALERLSDDDDMRTLHQVLARALPDELG